jgi:hypothetical protein
MAQASGNISGPPPAPQKGEDVLRWAREMYNWAKKTQAIPGANILSTQTQSGRVFNAKPGGGAPATPPHPWKTTRNDDTETETKRVRVHPGSIGGVVPTNVFPPLTISGTGLEFVVLDVSINPANGGVSSCSLSIESTQPTPPVPTPSAPTSSFADVIAVIYDGSVYQVRSRNLNAFSQELFQETVEEPAIGERNYIPWYVWNVVEAS